VLVLPKKNKNDKHLPNFIVFLVEGDSDRIALESALSELIYQKHPDYEVRFLLQEKVVNNSGEEVDDDIHIDDGYIIEDEYEYGGDITSSSFVTPINIERKIENRFIKPSTKTEGLYPRRIAKIIQIVDLDGAFISNDSVVPISPKRASLTSLFYNEVDGVIEALNVENIQNRNERKKKNLEYLLSLTDHGIKIGTRTIPYEIYFFSSNLDHFINKNANLENNKKKNANSFLRKYGLDLDIFCQFFFDDPASIGHLGYYESWEEIKQEDNSVKRFTNIDCLIRNLLI